MSPPFSLLTSSLFNHVEFEDPHHSGLGGYSNFPSTTRNHQLFVREHSVPGSSSSLSEIQHSLHEHRAYHNSDASVLPTTSVIHMPTSHNLNSWNSAIPQTVVDERQLGLENHMAQAPSAHRQVLDGIHWDNQIASCTDRQPPLPPVGYKTLAGEFGAYLHGYPSVSPSLTSLVLPPYPIHSNNHNVAAPQYLPLYQSFSPSLQHVVTHPNSLSSPLIHCAPRQSSTRATRRRPARAIEYDGLWIDEAELIQGLTEPNGNISILQCRWEEDRSPCYLRVKGNKSSIKVHIQKWHGGKPGGDKLKIPCRWPGCGMTMLKESIARHIVSIHLEEMWECQGCGKEFVRNDAYGKHILNSNLEACQNLGALITYSSDAKVVNARAALDGGGRLRCADA